MEFSNYADIKYTINSFYKPAVFSTNQPKNDFFTISTNVQDDPRCKIIFLF